MKRIYFFINGIRTKKGDPRNWTDRAVTWIQKNTDHRARKIEYFTFALTRWFKTESRAKLLVGKLKDYSDHEIVLVGHSNGCNVIAKALHLAGQPKIKEIHLISAACKADFDKTRFNESSCDTWRVYIAEKDFALKLASSRIGRLLGYGTLGKVGPVNPQPDFDIEVIKRPYKHSEWFSSDHFEDTMQLILG